MAELFAAVGVCGQIRFIDEVARGAACNCRCPECASPLVAKQGDLKTWHFAHEAGQERPECAVGAANMLRRVAIAVLRSIDPLKLPPYQVNLKVDGAGHTWRSSVELPSGRSAAWAWTESPSRRAAAATSRLIDGVPVELHVEVMQPAAEGAGEVAVVSYVLSLPPLEELQSREAAHRHIRERGAWAWRHRPDPAGAVAAETSRLKHEAALATAAAEAQTRQADEVRRREAAAAVAQARQLDDERRHADEHLSVKRAELSASILRHTPERATGASLILYRLRDGTSWLVYELVDGNAGLVQWPTDQENTLVPPGHVAKFDERLQIYRTSASAAIGFLAPRAANVRNDSDPVALARWATENLMSRRKDPG